MRRFFFVLTTLISSTLAFLPALFSLENYVKSFACVNISTDRLNRVCHKLASVPRLRNYGVSALHGSWRQLLPSDAKRTTYQTIDFDNKFALATTVFSNGTRVELVMPFESTGEEPGNTVVHFTFAKKFTTYADDSRFLNENATCSAQSFEVVYASTSLRVDRMLTGDEFRVFVPRENAFEVML